MSKLTPGTPKGGDLVTKKPIWQKKRFWVVLIGVAAALVEAVFDGFSVGIPRLLQSVQDFFALTGGP